MVATVSWTQEELTLAVHVTPKDSQRVSFPLSSLERCAVYAKMVELGQVGVSRYKLTLARNQPEAQASL